MKQEAANKKEQEKFKRLNYSSDHEKLFQKAFLEDS